MNAIAPEVHAAAAIVFALSEAIRGLGEVPAGHLYAHVMDRLSLEAFECSISLLVESGVVERRGHLLVWKGVQS